MEILEEIEREMTPGSEQEMTPGRRFATSALEGSLLLHKTLLLTAHCCWTPALHASLFSTAHFG